MYKKPYYRLYFLRELNEFKKYKIRIDKQEKINQLLLKIKEYNKAVGDPNDHKFLLDIPDKFEYIIHTNVKLISNAICSYDELNQLDFDNDAKIRLYKYEVCWDNIEKQFNDYYFEHEANRISSPDVSLALNKKVAYIALIKSELLCVLLKRAFKVIDTYFKLDELGLPSEDFLVELINSFFDEDNEIIKDKIKVENALDFHYISLLMENKYLINKLYQNGIAVNKEMIEDGFIFDKEVYKEIFKKNPVHYIRLNPKTKKTFIKENADIIRDIEKLEYQVYTDIASTKESMALDTFSDKVKLFVNKRINEHKDIATIIDELKEEGKGYVGEIETVRKSISEICELAGFSDLEKEIKRYQSYNKR
ncbi:hypothetical protein SAMN05660462_03036 [Proteiniborus ethanoligenes]|uniref:Uncharacterized protein n=1 Tax=Proteiniborus ethanoligenes TaxID=415015 RepID=A0A1H3SR53_9FIRM|nr:hypothetical protein [Proteiniborus ethanoligenes]SDZ40031.1 hypothetical protein SAMN05660462_03036 [Proteiniborus ethanoligenes]